MKTSQSRVLFLKETFWRWLTGSLFTTTAGPVFSSLRWNWFWIHKYIYYIRSVQAGTNSGLHIDAFGSHFWMYLVSGQKKWTFYPPEAAGSLNPVFYDSMDPVFRPEDDILQDIPHYSLNLGPGQLLFVPAGSPHKVILLSNWFWLSALAAPCPHKPYNFTASILIIWSKMALSTLNL